MTNTLHKIELFILGLLQKGINGRHIRVENSKEEKLVCPMNMHEINASLNLPESDLTGYIDNLKSMKLLQSAKMNPHNILYYWISNEGLELLNSYDSGIHSISLLDDKHFKKILIEKSINIIRDAFFDKFYTNGEDLEFALNSLDQDMQNKIQKIINNTQHNDTVINDINILLDEQAKRYLLPPLKTQQLNREYKNLSVKNLIPLNDKELIDFKEYLKILTELKTKFIFSKDQSELHEDYSAYIMSEIPPELVRNVFKTIQQAFPFDQNEKLTLHLTVSKYAYLPDIFYIARLLIQNDKNQYSIGYTVSNNFRFIFESLKGVMKGKKKFYHNINTPLKRFNLVFNERKYFEK